MRYLLILIVISIAGAVVYTPAPVITEGPDLIQVTELKVDPAVTPIIVEVKQPTELTTVGDVTELTIINTGDPIPHVPLDTYCLAKNIYHEARGEDLLGRLAVAQVTLNRTNHKNYPGDICGVVMQRAQFSWTLIKRQRWSHPNNKSWQAAKRLADQFLNKGVRVKGLETALFYHTTQVSPRWKKPEAIIAQIGTHIFYKSARPL